MKLISYLRNFFIATSSELLYISLSFWQMETSMQPVKEYFMVSVDVARGVTFVSGTTFGKQFLLENLSRMAKTNIFSAFLAFCREKMIGTCIWKFYRDEIIIENSINVWSTCTKLDLYEFYFRFSYFISFL